MLKYVKKIGIETFFNLLCFNALKCTINYTNFKFRYPDLSGSPVVSI